MRFDDMIATVLAQPARGAADNVARWRQLVDLLAQRRAATAGDTAERAYAWLAEHRAEVGLLVRQQAAQTLAWRRIEPRLLGFFAGDHPSVAQPLVSTCRLDSAEWLALLPSLSPTARGLLRHRRDLPVEVEQALEAFGTSDFQLGSPDAEAAAASPAGSDLSPGAEKGEVQIRELVARIEAYRRQKETAATEPFVPEAEAEAEPADGFRWECGPDGIILWVHGAPRGPLVGQSIASIAERGQFGVDGQAAGAFEKRSPFRDARFSVPGEGAAAGDWRISGVPFFEPHRGHFLGYRGSARRPRLDEVARSAAEGEGEGGGVFGT
ncbi:MAG TPA: sensor histidine kinase, partial [Allosphingosinicella sp.]